VFVYQAASMNSIKVILVGDTGVGTFFQSLRSIRSSIPFECAILSLYRPSKRASRQWLLLTRNWRAIVSLSGKRYFTIRATEGFFPTASYDPTVRLARLLFCWIQCDHPALTTDPLTRHRLTPQIPDTSWERMPIVDHHGKRVLVDLWAVPSGTTHGIEIALARMNARPDW